MLKLSSFSFNNNSGLILLNKNLYNKTFFVEEDVSLLESFIVVDNSNFYSFLFCNKRYLKRFGSSLNTRFFFFSNNLNYNIKFDLNVSFFPNIYSRFLGSLNKVLFCLEKLKKLSSICENNTLIFLRSVRSGFKVFYQGVIAFFPHYSYKSVYLKIINSLFLKNFFYILYIKCFYSKILLRLSFSQFSLHHCVQQKRKRKRKKKSITNTKRIVSSPYTTLNFYFLNRKRSNYFSVNNSNVAFK